MAVLGILWGVHRWLAKVGYTTSEFPKLVQEIRDELKGIRDQIQQIFKLLPRQPVVGASPLKLTDFGEKIADNIQAQAWADKVAPGLVREVADMRPFEIDQFSNTYVETRLPKECTNGLLAPLTRSERRLRMSSPCCGLFCVTRCSASPNQPTPDWGADGGASGDNNPNLTTTDYLRRPKRCSYCKVKNRGGETCGSEA